MPTSENKNNCVRSRTYWTVCILSKCINNLRKGVWGYTVLIVTAALVWKMSIRGVRRAFRSIWATFPQIFRPFVHHSRHNRDTCDYEQKLNMLTLQHLFSLSCVSAQLRRCALQYSSAGTLSCSLSFTANLFIANICCVFSSNVQSKCAGLRDFSSLIIDKSRVHRPGLIFPRGRNC